MKIPHQLSLEVQYVNLIVEQPQNHHQIQTKKKWKTAILPSGDCC